MSEDIVDNTNTEVNVAEQEARTFGWVPKEEFHGNQDEWKDAETFLRRGKEINGFLRKDLDKIKTQLTAKDGELAEIKQTMQEYKKFVDENAKRELATALATLKEQKKQAISEGDGELVVAIDDQIAELKQTKEVPVEQEKPKVDPQSIKILEDWLADNPVFAKDKTVMKLTDATANEVKREYPHLVGVNFLNEVAKRVKEELPHKFSNGATDRPSPVGTSSDSGAGRTSNTKKRTYSDLPQEAKKACDKFVKQGLLTQADYVAQYDWDN